MPNCRRLIAMCSVACQFSVWQSSLGISQRTMESAMFYRRRTLKSTAALHAMSALMTQHQLRTRQNEAAKNTICTSSVPAAYELRPCGLPWRRQLEPLPCLKSGNLTLPLATSLTLLIGLLRSFSALQGDETPCPERRQPPSHAGDSIA